MMKQLATGMTLALLCLPAMADSDLGFYSGVGAARVTLKDSIGGFRIKETGAGYSVFGGYRFNEYGSLEIAYMEGDADDTISAVQIETDASAIQGSALLQVPISARFEGFARVGFIAWEAEHFATGVPGSLETDGTDWLLGIGAEWHVTPKFGVRAEYSGAELGGTDLRALTLGGLVRF